MAVYKLGVHCRFSPPFFPQREWGEERGERGRLPLLLILFPFRSDSTAAERGARRASFRNLRTSRQEKPLPSFHFSIRSYQNAWRRTGNHTNTVQHAIFFCLSCAAAKKKRSSIQKTTRVRRGGGVGACFACPELLVRD